MPEKQYDVIVVGARCAGSATARLIAQKGYRTLLLDRSQFPSDMPMSTHLIWSGGASILERWGLLDAVRASGAPGMRSGTLNLGEFTLTGHPPAAEVAESFAPRRFVLDAILLEGARAAGVEFREDFDVTDVAWDGDRVVGVVGRGPGGVSEVLSASLVIGADGRNSRIARAVSAESYNELPESSVLRFSYFSGVPAGMEFFAGLRRMLVAFPTNDDRTMVSVTWPIDELDRIRDDFEGHVFAELEQWAPDLAARVRAGKREESWHGASVTAFCRTPAGAGWALVGDAGMTVDPITAAGITNAFRSAELLADAADEGLSGRQSLDAALATYGAQRDAALMPMYQFTAQMARLDPPTPDVQQLFGGLRNSQEDTDKYFGVFAQTVPVTEFFDPANLGRIMAAA